MEDAVTQRVNEFRKTNGLSILGLSKAINIGQATLNKQLKEDGCGVSISTVVNILDAYPELSAEWLLRGEGEMRRGIEFTPQESAELVDSLRDHVSSLKDMVSMLKEELSRMKEGYGFAAAEGR